MASKRRTLKKRNYRKKKLYKKNKTPKYNKRKVKSQKRRNCKTNKSKKLYKMQKGGVSTTNLVSHNLLDAARYVPHTLTNAYNGLVGNEIESSFLPWEGHYS